MLKMSLGFTLIEVLVAISILGIAALVAIPNYHRFNETEKLSNAATNLASVLKTVETNAQSSINCNTNVPNNWSISLDTTNDQYTLSCQYTDSTGTVVTYKPASATMVDIGMPLTIVGVCNTTTDCDTTCPVTAPQATFSHSTTTFNQTGSCTGPLRMTLTDSALSSSYCIDVGQGGVINVYSC